MEWRCEVRKVHNSLSVSRAATNGSKSVGWKQQNNIFDIGLFSRVMYYIISCFSCNFVNIPQRNGGLSVWLFFFCFCIIYMFPGSVRSGMAGKVTAGT